MAKACSNKIQRSSHAGWGPLTGSTRTQGSRAGLDPLAGCTSAVAADCKSSVAAEEAKGAAGTPAVAADCGKSSVAAEGAESAAGSNSSKINVRRARGNQTSVFLFHLFTFSPVASIGTASRAPEDPGSSNCAEAEPEPEFAST